MVALRVTPFAAAGVAVTVNFAVTTLPATVQFDNILPQGGGFRKSNTVRLFNGGSSLLFFELCGSADNNRATIATGIPLGSGVAMVLSTAGATFVSAVCAPSNTSTLYVTPGEGGI